MASRKAYLVTSGCYSDYGVDAVFTSEDSALAYIEAGGGETVEEFDLDPAFARLRPGHRLCRVAMMRDGSTFDADCRLTPEPLRWNKGEAITYALRVADAESAMVRILPPRKFRLPDGNPRPWVWLDSYMTTVVQARDAEHAIKIANERRAAVIAGEHWPTDITNVVNVTLGPKGVHDD